MTTPIPKRKMLVGRKGRKKKDIDLVEIYRLIDQGKTLREIAADIGVSESTIRRRHIEEQERQERQERIPEPVNPWIEELLNFDPEIPNLDLPAEPEPKSESDQNRNAESGPRYVGKFKKFSKL